MTVQYNFKIAIQVRHYSPLANVFDSFSRIAVHALPVGRGKEKGQTHGLA